MELGHFTLVDVRHGVLGRQDQPSSAVPAGMAFLGGDFRVAHMGTLYRLDAVSGEMRRSFQIEGSITDICTDGKYLFGVEAGWTAGRKAAFRVPARHMPGCHLCDPGVHREFRHP